MSDTIQHAGYTGTAQISVSDKVLHGKILNIPDLITYEGETVDALIKAFVSAVTDYKKTLAELNRVK